MKIILFYLGLSGLSAMFLAPNASKGMLFRRTPARHLRTYRSWAYSEKPTRNASNGPAPTPPKPRKTKVIVDGVESDLDWDKQFAPESTRPKLPAAVSSKFVFTKPQTRFTRWQMAVLILMAIIFIL